MKNLLCYIDVLDLNCIAKRENMPVSFEYIPLHSRNKVGVLEQLDKFFAGNKICDHYFTDSSDYQYHGGWRYVLMKDNKGYYWLVLSCEEKIEV